MAKRVFVRNYWYENIRHLFGHSHENQVIFMWNVLLMHSVCKRQLRRWKLSLHMCQAFHQASNHSSFCSMKQLGVFLLPSPHPWMGCITIAGLPPSIKFASTYLYTWEDTEALWEWSVSPKNTIQCSQSGLESRLLEIEKKYKNQITGCLHRLLTTFEMDNYWKWNIVFKLICTWCSVKE